MPVAAHRTDYIGFAGNKFSAAIAALLDAGFEIQASPLDLEVLANSGVVPNDHSRVLPIDVDQLSAQVGSPSFLKIALDGNWETGLVLELKRDASLANIEAFIGEATNVAFQIFFTAPNDTVSFVGVRLYGRTKTEQATIIFASLQSVCVGGWNSFTKVVNGLRLLIQDGLFPSRADLLEIGVVGAWKSIGSAVIWRKRDPAPSRQTIQEQLERHTALTSPTANPIGLEFGFDSPLPHWIALQISDLSDDGHKLNLERLHKLANCDSE